ncbi:uncharacterized protein LOC130591467 [Beta vulgaris subsp. vulgaris]|uniref:uncharacterized protein LOC130591467 n=1 Tax=Beta vulgaris subsp. vulgaris TaxID=3555 RepID=UPI00053FD441|nr:uncharacterized protein LOC130591467 [Beta vulgaris subsp. vulgaris]
MRFAPEVVPTEALKAQRFEQGLTLSLQGKLGGATFSTLDEVYGRDAHLYGIRGKEQEGNSSGEKRKGNGNHSNHGNEKKFKGGSERRDGRNLGARTNDQTSRNQSGGESPKRVFHCKKCNKNHPGKDCEGKLVTCRYCQKLGHREYECYWKSEGKPLILAQDNKTIASNPSNPTQQSGSAKPGNGNGNSQTKGLLFDSAASHSFMTRTLAERLGLVSLEYISVSFALPSGEELHCSKLYRQVPLLIAGIEFPSDLIEYEMKDLDVILGMD